MPITGSRRDDWRVNWQICPSPLITALVPDSANFLYVDRSELHDVFAKNLSDAEVSLLAVT